MSLTAEKVRELYNYFPETGLFTRKKRTKNRLENSPAGCIDKSTGYVRIGVGDKIYHGHRIAWLHYYGEFPKEEIDHINGNRSDNRICNLRAVSRKENARNLKTRIDSSTGCVGTYLTKYGKYAAQLHINGKHIFLGNFNTLEEAALAREKGNKLYNFHENHGKR